MSRQTDSKLTLRKIDAALAAGDIGRGLGLARHLTREHPNDASAWTALGVTQSRGGLAADAEGSLRRATELDPESGEAHQWLANLLRTGGRSVEAEKLLTEAARRWPEEATTYSLLGNVLLELNDPAGASNAFSRAATIEPDAAVHAHNQGIAFQRLGDLDGAVAAFQRATRLAPDVPTSHISLAQLLLRLNDSLGCAAAFREAHRCEPDTLRGGLQLAQALIEERRYDEAIHLLSRLTETEPRSDAALLLLGRLQQRLGRFEDAETSLRGALQRRPGNLRLYFDIAYGRKIKPDDGVLVDEMERRLIQSAPKDPGRLYLDYALGKAYDDLGRYEEAMTRFDAANTAMLAQLAPTPFDPAAHTAYFDELIATFTPDFFIRYDGYRDPSERPVFVVGMIRSGTTLIDQILSNHPEVSSLDENSYWPRRLAGFFPPDGAFPPSNAVRTLAKGYSELLQEFGGDCARVTNKLPTNFAVLGAIHLAFPNARIVHVRRHPIDNLLSIYQTRFPNPVRYAHSKRNLVAYYRQYRRLMDHWRAVLPPNRFLEIDYERLVGGTEPVVRQMVGFLGLPWDDLCLHPEANPHEIRTPSAWQARQPIFRSSVAKWRRYEAWLGELAELQDEEA